MQTPFILLLFECLVKPIEDGTLLFLVIDGINFYERSERRHDPLKVIQSLMTIIKNSRRCVMNLLLTCHGRSSFVKDLLEKDAVLNVPTFVDGSRQGWSEHTFEDPLVMKTEKPGSE